MNLFVYIFLAFVTGLVSGFIPAIPFIIVISALYTRKILNISIALAMLAGALLSQAPVITEEGVYSGCIKIERVMKYDYTGTWENRHILVKSSYPFIEGDRIFCTFIIMDNNGKSGFYQYLRQQGICSIAKIQHIDSVNAGMSIERIRAVLCNRVKTLYSRDAGGFLNSILFGMRNDLSDNIREGFLQSGAMHFLAISGLHTGIIYAMLIFLISLFPAGKKVKMIIVLPILLFYALLTYMNPPVFRAVLFIGFSTAGILLKREAETENIIMMTAIIMLMLNPLNIHSVSFMLSFLAVYAVMRSYRGNNRFMRTVLPGASVMLLTGPLVMNRFSYISLLSPASAIVLFPFVAVLMIGGILSLIPGMVFLVPAIERIYYYMGLMTGKLGSSGMFFEGQADIPETLLMCLAGLLVINRHYRAASAMLILSIVVTGISLL